MGMLFISNVLLSIATFLFASIEHVAGTVSFYELHAHNIPLSSGTPSLPNASKTKNTKGAELLRRAATSARDRAFKTHGVEPGLPLGQSEPAKAPVDLISDGYTSLLAVGSASKMLFVEPGNTTEIKMLNSRQKRPIMKKLTTRAHLPQSTLTESIAYTEEGSAAEPTAEQDESEIHASAIQEATRDDHERKQAAAKGKNFKDAHEFDLWDALFDVVLFSGIASCALKFLHKPQDETSSEDSPEEGEGEGQGADAGRNTGKGKGETSGKGGLKLRRKSPFLKWDNGPIPTSRKLYGTSRAIAKWFLPAAIAGFSFWLQNYQLRVGTYLYVHKMVQYDLQRGFEVAKVVSDPQEDIHLSFGHEPEDVSFGSLHDEGSTALGDYQEVDISFLDALAALFPFLFVFFTIGIDDLEVWTRIMICFSFLAVGKGFFSWCSVMPDSNGWDACQKRLSTSYTVEWYSKKRNMWWDSIFMNPVSRLCADMMYSGHTYFVAIFAFGLHESVRSAMMESPSRQRFLAEFVVGLSAVVQQGVEVYFVLKSRFHYTADVVMAVVLTYLFYTNRIIASMAHKFVMQDRTTKNELRESMMKENKESQIAKVYVNGRSLQIDLTNKWLNPSNGVDQAMKMGPDCCCLNQRQYFLYEGEDLVDLLTDIEEATTTNDKKWEMSSAVKQTIMQDIDIDREVLDNSARLST